MVMKLGGGCPRSILKYFSFFKAAGIIYNVGKFVHSLMKLIIFLYDYFTAALRVQYMYLIGGGGWTEFTTFNSPYLLKSCTFSMHGKMSAVLAIVTQ